MINLLITLRDVGATVNLIEIIREAKKHQEIGLHILAQEPSIAYLEQAGIHEYELVNFKPLTDRRSPDSAQLLSFAKQKIDKIQPDAILTGLSSPRDAGIDEAIIAVAPETIKTFVMQDFWGEINTFFDKFANTYFCLDNEAVRLTKKNHGVHALNVGSPRHIGYQALSTIETRFVLREQLNIDKNQTVIGIFGQSLHFLPGYYETIRDLLHALERHAPDTMVLFRKHPRETSEEAQEIIRMIESSGMHYRLANQLSVEQSLLVCNTVCSIFSNCIYDACYLNYFSELPLLTPVILAYHPDIIKYARQFDVYEASPYKNQNLAFVCESNKQLANHINHLLSEDSAKLYSATSKEVLKSPALSAKLIIEEIMRCVKD